MQPLAAVCTRNDALCTQYGAERNIAERGKSRVKLSLGVLVSRFLTPGGEYLVSIVIVVVTAAAVTVVVVMMVLVVMIVVMLMLMVVIVAAAGAVLVMLVMMLVLLMVMLMLVLVFVLIMVVVMVVMMMLVVRLAISSRTSATRSRLPSMVESSCSPVRSFHGVVTMRACSFRPRSMATVSSRRFSGHSAVRDSRMAPACAT